VLLLLLALPGCTGDAPEPPDPPGPTPVVEASGASLAETCAVLYDPRRSPVAGVELTLPYVQPTGAAAAAARSAAAEVDALLGAAADDGSPVLTGPVRDLRRLYARARAGTTVPRAELLAAVDHLGDLCGPEVVHGAGWAGWPN
jgi:hypothetical protein